MPPIEEPVAKVTFRQAKPTDLKTLSKLIRHYYAFDHIAFDTTAVHAGLNTMLNNKSVGQAFLIAFEATLIGYAILTYGFDLEFGGRTALITDLFIETKFRRRGLGRKTLQFLEQFCRSKKIGALELQVERTNKAAQAFYRGLDFEAHDRIPMTKRLNTRPSRQ
ncbi:MAG TPA: GNAT family N-acetyltransferase [Verrucomicrobiae bacterium]|nr:GNAT family N-acetyltransferase [Verrucomicrobiae bacterium]